MDLNVRFSFGCPAPVLPGLKTLEDSVSKLTDKIAELGDHVTALEARDAAVKALLADLKQQITSGADDQAVLDSIAALEARIDAVDQPDTPAPAPTPTPTPAPDVNPPEPPPAPEPTPTPAPDQP